MLIVTHTSSHKDALILSFIHSEWFCRFRSDHQNSKQNGTRSGSTYVVCVSSYMCERTTIRIGGILLDYFVVMFFMHNHAEIGALISFSSRPQAPRSFWSAPKNRDFGRYVMYGRLLCPQNDSETVLTLLN